MLFENALLRGYLRGGSVSSALSLFGEMPVRDVVSWNTMVSGYVGLGCWAESVGFFCSLRKAGFLPTLPSFVSVFVAVGELGWLPVCRALHGELLKLGYSADCKAGNAAMSSYVKCSCVGDARGVFDGMCGADDVSFEILLRGCSQCGKWQDAFELFKCSCALSVCLSGFAVAGLVSCCSSMELGINQGVQVHGFLVKGGFNSDNSVVNSLITMYASSFRLEGSKYLFNGLKDPDIVSWNSLIRGYAVCGFGDLGVGVVSRFLYCGLRMNESTFSSFLSCSASVTALDTAKMVHGLVLKLREGVDLVADNILLTMYGKCCSLANSKVLFRSMANRNSISYYLLTKLLFDQGFFEEVVRITPAIQSDNFAEVNEPLLSCVISSCSKLTFIDLGRQIHCCVMKTGFHSLLHIQNSFIELYANCGEVGDMENIFREIDSPDVFSWNTMIMGYSHSGFSDDAINVWHDMNEQGYQLNEFSYSVLMDLCESVRHLAGGEQLQARVYKLGLTFDIALMNSMLSMYANCGMMKKASIVFREINPADIISWNAMVSGYAENGLTEECVRYYLFMCQDGLKPNYVTFLSVSKSCAILADASLGSQIHAQVIRWGLESETSISNSLLTMYAKGGIIGNSVKIFKFTTYKDLIAWNSMINAYSFHGLVEEALQTYNQMKKTGLKPTSVTFIGVLSACSRGGLVSQAWNYFSSMHEDYAIVPGEEHYCCMVDVLCRKGLLTEAKNFIEKMPFEPNALIWRTLLSACRQYGNINLGEEAAKRMMEKDSHDATAYVLLSNIYASLEKRAIKAEWRDVMGFRGLRKEVGFSWIRTGNELLRSSSNL